MPQFKLEERYIVVKRRDISPAQEEYLKGFLRATKMPTRECVVIESDDSLYPTVVDLLREKVEKGDG